MKQEHIAHLRSILGANRVLIEGLKHSVYGADESSVAPRIPGLVVLPQNTAEVQKIMNYCNDHELGVVVRGGGTGLMGGAVPESGGLVVSLERMNRILDFNPDEKTVRVEAGKVNYELQEFLESKGLYFPCDPGSWGTAQIGGNIATNASGPMGARYGSCGRYVQNLEVVLANGKRLITAPNTEKFSGGIAFTQLFVGTEGQLGIITQATLKLVPKPQMAALFLFPFDEANRALQAVPRIKSGFNLNFLEFMSKESVLLTQQHFKEKSPLLSPAHYLLVGLCEKNYPELGKLLEDLQIDENQVLIAEDSAKIKSLLNVRKLAPLAAKANGFTLEHDCVMQISHLPDFNLFLQKWAKKYRLDFLLYGHAANGNLHLRLRPQPPDCESNYHDAVLELFKSIKGFGGSLSGEHGVGELQKELMPLFFDETQLDLQMKFKKFLDPKGILNPGKVWHMDGNH